MRHAPFLGAPDFELYGFFVIFGGLIPAIIGNLIAYFSGRSGMNSKDLWTWTAFAAIPVVGWIYGLIMLWNGITCLISSDSTRPGK